MSIGTGWAEDSWIDASWIVGAWSQVVGVILEFGAGDDEDEDRLIMAIIKSFVRKVS